MSANSPDYVWLKEPVKADDTYAYDGESTLNWLQRSTHQLAKDSRYFLNHNLGKIPNHHRKLLVQQLKHNWQSALFELILARYLQELGANLDYEKPINGGKRPDFLANFNDGTVIIEATSPVIDSDLKITEKNNQPLIQYIEKTKPYGWLILLLRLPEIGPADSKKEFKKKIDSIFNQVRSTSENEISITETISTGKIALQCIRTNKKYKRIGGGPILTSWDDTENRIRHSIDKKREQVRDSTIPVILAINATGLSSSIEDFNHALFGRSIDVIDFKSLDPQYTYYKEDGLFTKKKSADPTFAGILACFNYGLAGGEAPILYHNPNYLGEFPKGFSQLEQRHFDFYSQTITVEKQKNNYLVERLNFPTH